MQQLAAGLVAGSRGLDRGHIGGICEALIRSGLDLSAWTAKQLIGALNADMKLRGRDWPNRIDNPGAFLASRLRLLPVRPEGVSAGGVGAASPDGHHQRYTSADSAPTSRHDAQAVTDRWYGDVQAASTAEERALVLRAHEVQFGSVVDPVSALAGAGRRAARLYPGLELGAALVRWAGDVLGSTGRESVAVEQVRLARSLSTDLLMDLAIGGGCNCVVCGSDRGTYRPELPLKAMATVCDHCWPAIAADLAAGEADAEFEEIPA